jgi:phospholipid/cholesterol/gamma-HCH transport system substrate-binding protein
MTALQKYLIIGVIAVILVVAFVVTTRSLRSRNSFQKEVGLGAMVLVAVAAFIAGTLWLRGKTLGRDDVYVVYRDVNTLKDASPVRISGALVGRVDGVRYVTPGHVVVGLKFSHSIPVTSNATAAITAVGMLGDQMVVFNPGNGTPVPRGDTIQGTVAPGLFDKAADLANKADETMSRLDAMLDTQLVVDLRHTLESTQRLMTYLADRTNGPTAQLTPTMLALQHTSAQLDSTLAAVHPAALQARLDSTMQSAGNAADRLAAMTARADSLIARIQHGDGTLGKFISDTSLYTDLRHTMQAMTDLLTEIKKNPGKIGVTVKVF